MPDSQNSIRQNPLRPQNFVTVDWDGNRNYAGPQAQDNDIQINNFGENVPQVLGVSARGPTPRGRFGRKGKIYPLDSKGKFFFS